MFRPTQFRPSFDKYAGQVCGGVMLHVTDPLAFRPVATYLTLICMARQQAPEQFQFLTRSYEFVSDRLAFDLLTGGTEAREAILDNQGADSVVDQLCPVPTDYPEFVQAAEARLERAQA
jgi:uncharacterized protein YbbC (DUF1343 family)